MFWAVPLFLFLRWYFFQLMPSKCQVEFRIPVYIALNRLVEVNSESLKLN